MVTFLVYRPPMGVHAASTPCYDILLHPESHGDPIHSIVLNVCVSVADLSHVIPGTAGAAARWRCRQHVRFRLSQILFVVARSLPVFIVAARGGRRGARLGEVAPH